MVFVFCKQKTAYEMRISDWSSDVCSSDLEFSRLNINYTVMSKRKLTQLVAEGLVDGWDDPRMYTLQGLRRRGYTPASLRLLVDRVGISKQNSVIDFSVLEGCLRDDLDAHAPRRMAVVEPLKFVLEIGRAHV